MGLILKEKASGALYGYAIGDALGLGSEFMTLPERKMRYPQGLRDYSQIIRDLHRSNWKPGEWTNDTTIILLLIDSVARQGCLDLKDYAAELRRWSDGNTIDNCACMRWVLSREEYLSDPVGVSRAEWKRIKNLDATNEGLGRGLFGGMWRDSGDLVAESLTAMTHASPRCEAASRVIARMAHDLTWNDRETPYEELLAFAREIDRTVAAYVEMARHGRLSELNLDEPSTYNYVRKTMAAALWVLWHCGSPAEGITTLCDAAGDADTNAALGGALLGLKYGGASMPRNLIDGLSNRDEIESRVPLLVDAIQTEFRP